MLLIKKEVLKQINKLGSVSYKELAALFNCTESRAANRLKELKREELVDNKPKGRWYLTYYGERRLAYYERSKK
jgi:Mn-dependent DtxR family transcriptional regulator